MYMMYVLPRVIMVIVCGFAASLLAHVHVHVHVHVVVFASLFS